MQSYPQSIHQPSQQLFPHPFSAAYWQEAVREISDPRKLAFAALMIALCAAIGMVPSIPVAQGVRVSWGFLARALCALVCGPALGVAFGFAEDILNFFNPLLSTGYPFFFGYTLSTMIGVFIYALFLYRANLTPQRVFLAKLLTNVENVTLGALWTSILNGKAYLVVAPVSALKNLLMLPFQAYLLAILIDALLPVLRQMNLVPRQTESRLRQKH